MKTTYSAKGKRNERRGNSSITRSWMNCGTPSRIAKSLIQRRSQEIIEVLPKGALGEDARLNGEETWGQQITDMKKFTLI